MFFIINVDLTEEGLCKHGVIGFVAAAVVGWNILRISLHLN